MGRARRKDLQEMIRPITEGNMVPMRIFAPSPASGGAEEAPFLRRLIDGPHVANPSFLPQGPAKKEDGEDNPEAALIEDIAPGQIGEDLQGRSFQLLASEGQPPQRLLIRSLANEEVFWVDAASEPTLKAETLSYRTLPPQQLVAWAKECQYGSDAEDALWAMKEKGFFDMQVRDRTVTLTLIGNWIIRDRPESPDNPEPSYSQYSSPRTAGIVARLFAENVETYPAIQDFNQRMQSRTLPGVDSAREELRQNLFRALIGGYSRKKAADDLEEEARRESQATTQNSMLSLSLGFRELDPLPKIDDPLFLQRIGPLWKMVSQINL